MKNSPSVKLDDVKGQVIRPAISRWLSNWASPFRDASGYDEIAGRAAGSSPVLLQQEPVQIEFARCRGLIGQLRQQRLEIQAAQTRCTEKLSLISANVNRAHAHRELALERLMLNNESVPEPGTTHLSMLQESYLNFTVALRLLEQKYSRAMQKRVSLDAQQEQLVTDLQAHKEVLRQLQQRIDDDHPEEDGFKRAA